MKVLTANGAVFASVFILKFYKNFQKSETFCITHASGKIIIENSKLIKTFKDKIIYTLKFK